MIEIKGLVKDYEGVQVLHGITETIQKGEKVAIIGPSGSGKSTLLRCLNLLEKPTDGQILYKGQDITAKTTNINTVRQLECCSGDLADLKVKSCDIEAWSPRQQKYFEVCSCSNLGDAQSRRLKIRVKGDDGRTYLPHTLNNTCVAPPRMLIALLENNLQADGSVRIPEVLRPYMGGKEKLVPKKA